MLLSWWGKNARLSYFSCTQNFNTEILILIGQVCCFIFQHLTLVVFTNMEDFLVVPQHEYWVRG